MFITISFLMLKLTSLVWSFFDKNNNLDSCVKTWSYKICISINYYQDVSRFFGFSGLTIEVEACKSAFQSLT